MDFKKSSPLPLAFRAAAFYVFFSIFFFNAQPFAANWNDPFSLFLQNIYSYFWSTETTSTTVDFDNPSGKSEGGIEPCQIFPDPPPPPPPPDGATGG